MNYRVKNKLIEAICNSKTLYVKDTGVKVNVIYYGTDLHEVGRDYKTKLEYCNIEFVDIPTTKCLKQLVKFHVRDGDNPGTMYSSATILLENLSLTPFETKAAKLLYKPRK